MGGVRIIFLEEEHAAQLDTVILWKHRQATSRLQKNNSCIYFLLKKQIFKNQSINSDVGLLLPKNAELTSIRQLQKARWHRCRSNLKASHTWSLLTSQACATQVFDCSVISSSLVSLSYAQALVSHFRLPVLGSMDVWHCLSSTYPTLLTAKSNDEDFWPQKRPRVFLVGICVNFRVKSTPGNKLASCWRCIDGTLTVTMTGRLKKEQRASSNATVAQKLQL